MLVASLWCVHCSILCRATPLPLIGIDFDTKYPSTANFWTHFIKCRIRKFKKYIKNFYTKLVTTIRLGSPNPDRLTLSKVDLNNWIYLIITHRVQPQLFGAWRNNAISNSHLQTELVFSSQQPTKLR